MKTTTTARVNGTTSRGKRRFAFHPHLLRKEEANCFQRKEEANCQLDMRERGGAPRPPHVQYHVPLPLLSPLLQKADPVTEVLGVLE